MVIENLCWRLFSTNSFISNDTIWNNIEMENSVFSPLPLTTAIPILYKLRIFISRKHHENIETIKIMGAIQYKNILRVLALYY